MFSKIDAVAIVVVTILMITAVCVGKIIPAIFSIIQFGGLVAALLMHSEEVIEDLDIDEADKCGIVESVSINGLSNFEGNTEFKSTAKVTIKYHSFKCINVPVSSDEAKFIDAELVVKAFKGAGFVEITTIKTREVCMIFIG